MDELALLIKRHEFDDDGFLVINYMYERNESDYFQYNEYHYNTFITLLYQILKKINHTITNINTTIYRKKKHDTFSMDIVTSLNKNNIDNMYVYYNKLNIRTNLHVINID